MCGEGRTGEERWECPVLTCTTHSSRTYPACSPDSLAGQCAHPRPEGYLRSPTALAEGPARHTPPLAAGSLRPMTTTGDAKRRPLASTRDTADAGRTAVLPGTGPPRPRLSSPPQRHPQRMSSGPSRGQSLRKHVHVMSVMYVKSACQ